MSSRDDILADRLNVEPAIFKGCSSSELGIIVGVAALVWLPVSLLLAGLMGAVTMGFGLAGVGNAAHTDGVADIASNPPVVVTCFAIFFLIAFSPR